MKKKKKKKKKKGILNLCLNSWGYVFCSLFGSFGSAADERMGNSLIELCVRSIFVVAPFAFLACLAQQSMKEQGIIFMQVMSKSFTCSGLFG